MPIIAKHVGKIIGTTPVLSDISLNIGDGDFLALTGRSGSGKSTLLYLLSTLDSPSAGTIEIEGKSTRDMTSDEMHNFRNAHMGFVFQFHFLIGAINVIDNVLMPAAKLDQKKQRLAFAESLLEQFELKDKMRRLPRQLSGGEQQRVAIARALIMEPQYLFADEPTGSLDSANAEQVMRILSAVNRQKKTTVLLVTHEPEFARLAGRQVRLADGKMVP